MGVGLDLFGGLVCVTSVEKDKFPTENFPEIKGSHREISGGKYTTEQKETSRCHNLAVAGHHLMLVLYGRLTFQPACVFRGLNKGLNCVCASESRAAYGTLFIGTPSSRPHGGFQRRDPVCGLEAGPTACPQNLGFQADRLNVLCGRAHKSASKPMALHLMKGPRPGAPASGQSLDSCTHRGAR